MKKKSFGIWTAARYVGGGNYLPGVPARDMTAAEWQAVDEGQREQALALKLYEMVPGASETAAPGLTETTEA